MFISRRFLALASLIAAVLQLAGCEHDAAKSASDLGDANSTQAFGSPDCAFEAARQASMEQDWQTYCHCLSPQGKSRLAKALLYGALQEDQLGGLSSPRGADDSAEDEGEILEEFGFRGQYTSDPKKLEVMLAQLDDIDAFICKMLAARCATNKLASPALNATAEMRNLQVEMTSAQAEVVQYREGYTYRNPVSFEQQDGDWKMNFVFIPDKHPKTGSSDAQ